MQQAAVLIQSLHDNYPSARGNIDFICLTDREDLSVIKTISSWVSAPNFNIKYREVVAPDSANIKSLGDSNWRTNISWYRLFLGSTLHDYDKVIFFDADMMAVSDLSYILDFPMYGKFLACVDASDDAAFRGMDDITTFHTGMFIADLNWWRESGVEEVFSLHMQTVPPSLYVEEELFNIYMRDVWYAIPFTFNFYYFYRDDDGDCIWDRSYLPFYLEKAIVIHFFGRAKPWNQLQVKGTRDTSKLGIKWRMYRDNLRIT